MPRTSLTLAETSLLLQPLVGLPISLPWKGYGSAIFLELGKLSPLEHSRQHHNKGEACISIEWDWRIEDGSKVLYGSSNSKPEIKHGIEGLRGVSIDNILVSGQVPELLIQFSNRQRLISAVMVSGDPAWSIRLPEARWVFCESGVVYVGDDAANETTEAEAASFAHAEKTAERWGVPMADPSNGRCNSCRWFMYIDGEGCLLDFGVCTSSSSIFDGRVVNVASGCGAFFHEAR